MPTVLRIGAYRFFFYSNEQGEPRHIHVQQQNMLANFWLQPVALASSSGFSAQDLRKLGELVTTHQTTFTEAWNEFFGA